MINLIDPEGLAAGFVAEWFDARPAVEAHTSGSTGTPKHIMLLKADMEMSARATCEFFGIGPHSVLHLPLSTDYIAGKMMVVRAAVSGATLIVERPTNRVLEHGLPCGVRRVDLTAVVPSQADYLASERSACVKAAIVGGGAMSAVTETRLVEAGICAYATYGMTETCSHVALRRAGVAGGAFQALPGIRFSSDARGCLVIESDRYSWRRLVTNDMVRLDSPYAMHWLGRCDNVINSGGIKLYPEEIERRLEGITSLPYYIGGRPSEKWGTEIVLYVECDSLADDQRTRMMDECARRLDRFSRPKEIVAAGEFSRTSSGKIIRNKN